MRLGHLLDILQINTGGDKRLLYKEKTLADVGATLSEVEGWSPEEIDE